MASVSLSIFVLFCSVVYGVGCSGLEERFSWSRITYKLTFGRVHRAADSQQGYENRLIFPVGNDQDNTIPFHFSDDPFIYENNIPLGANRWKDKLFITVPRRQYGIPSTLSYIHYNSTERHNVPLIPYPSSEANHLISLPGKKDIVSIYRIAVDPCDRLWMVDTGILEVPHNTTVLRKQKLIIMDLNTNQMIKTHYFTDSDLTPKTIFTIVALDVTRETCDDAYAYLPDIYGYGLVVYSLKKDTSWRIEHNYFEMEPTVGDLNIGGFKFRWLNGIFSIALTDLRPDGYRTAFFHSLIGRKLYKVSTKVLRNEGDANSYGEDYFTIVGDKGPNTHSSASDIHKESGILFFALVNLNAVGCWNTNKPFKKSNIGIVHRDDQKMIFPSDLKIYEDELIVLTNTMPVYVYSQLNYDETNFRVWTNNVYEVVRGTVCEQL